MVSYTSTIVASVFQTQSPHASYCYTSIMITKITSAWENHIKHYREGISGPVSPRMSANTLPLALNVFTRSSTTGSLLVFCILYQYTDIAMDFVGPFPKSDGYDMILVIMDRLTNYVRIEPTYSTATAPDIALLVHSTWCRQFGLPQRIVSDRDKLFMSQFWKTLHKLLGILQRSRSVIPII